MAYAERLRPMVADTSLVLNQALDRGRDVLLEGGQATLLDVDHGTYPFVTSSNRDGRRRVHRAPGIPPTRVTRVIGDPQGVHDAGRRGAVPDRAVRRRRRDAAEDRCRVRHDTGRPRRCGWYDAVIARYATRINGVTDFVLTKLDVLTGFEKVPVCVAYEVDGVRHDEMPVNQTDFHHAKPVYECFDGWGRTSPVPVSSTTCPRTRRPTCCASRS